MSERGQATVELVALLPLVLLAAFAAATILLREAAQERAGAAAQADAMALLQGGEPRSAARAVLSDAERSGATVRVAGRRGTVELRPRGPLHAIVPGQTARASADAGPEPGP